MVEILLLIKISHGYMMDKSLRKKINQLNFLQNMTKITCIFTKTTKRRILVWLETSWVQARNKPHNDCHLGPSWERARSQPD